MSERPQRAAMQSAWIALMAELEVDEHSAREAYARIVQRYAEPHRAYHTMSHVWQVLQDAQRLASYAQNQRLVQLAAWLHDVVYDPRATDNEERSAAYAGQQLEALGQPQALIRGVQRLILLTRNHEARDGDGDGQILSDADLATLGAPSPVYERYAEAIRREYAWVDAPTYRSGRVALLRRLLERPSIYYTIAMQEEREQQARQNLREEIERLSTDL